MKNFDKIVIDANAFYKYAKFGISDNNKVDGSKLINFLDAIKPPQIKVVASVTMMEIIVHFRDDANKIREALQFFFAKQFDYFQPKEGQPFYLDINEIRTANALSDVDLLAFAKVVCERKIESETDFAFAMIETILIPVVYRMTEGREGLVNACRDVLTNDKFISESKDELRQNLSKAYEDNKTHKIARDAFVLSMANIVFTLFICIIEIFEKCNVELSERYQQMIYDFCAEVKKPNFNFMSALKIILNPKSADGKKLLTDMKEYLQEALLEMGYNSMQIEHAKNIIERVFTDCAKLQKNDTEDNMLFHYHGDGTFVISFDENMQKTIEQNDRENYNLIRMFYK